MAAIVQPALGTLLGCDFVSPNTFVDIGEVLSVKLSPEVGSIETTKLASTAKTYRPGLPDPGELTFDVHLDPTDSVAHACLKTLASTPAVHKWKITYPTVDSGGSSSPTYETCTGFLTKFERSADGPEENLAASITVKLTGPIT